jgi:hypothetical protein
VRRRSVRRGAACRSRFCIAAHANLQRSECRERPFLDVREATAISSYIEAMDNKSYVSPEVQSEVQARAPEWEPVSWSNIIGLIGMVWALLALTGFLLIGWP